MTGSGGAGGAGWPRRVLPAALAFGCAALLFERISPQSFFDPDGYHQMALFRAWLRSGALPRVDTFAFTRTVVPAVQHEWGAGAVLYVLATRLGAGGVMVARWLLSTAIVVVAVRTARRRATPVVVAFCAAPAALLGAVAFTTIRAGVYTMLFLAVVLGELDRDRVQPRPRRFLLVWLPVMALWINLHGGWIVGVAAVALHAGEQLLRRRRARHLLAGLAAVPALMALTPYGRDYFAGWWRSITFPRGAVAEWAPLIRSSYVLGLAAFGLAILLLVYAVARRGPRGCAGLPFLLATTWAAWRHERHVALFALAWFTALPGWLAATPLGALLDGAVARRRVAAVVAAAALGAGAGLVAVNGGFVAWKLAPAVRISFDGRYEVAYAAGVLDEDRTIHGARPGWQAVLARYAPDALLARRDEPLAAALPGGTGLARAYRDDAYEVWARPALHLPARDATGAPVPVVFP
jgi:hypothetical protein